MDLEKQDRGDNLDADTAALDAEAAAAAAAQSAAEEAAKTAAALEAKGEGEDGAAKGEGEGEDGVARDEKGRFSASIPKARFDEAVNKERDARLAAEARLAELQAQLQQVDRNADSEALEAEIKELEKQHAQALLKGDADTAADLMGQIRLKERTIAIQGATNLSAQAKDQAREEVRMDAAIERLESTYEVLNPEHEKYDQGLVNLILASQRFLIDNQRMLPSAALVKATEEVMGRFARAATPPPKEDKGLQAGKGGDRKSAAVQKALDAAKKTPPSLNDAGLDSDKAGMRTDVDPSKLTPEEFAALPEATLKRLRGDMIDA